MKKLPPHPKKQIRPSRVSLARALSKLGYCSRSQAKVLIAFGKVQVNGTVHRREDMRVDPDNDRIAVNGRPVTAEAEIYLMLNKPRGMVTTRSDEQGRKTVYDCFGDGPFPWLAPVGRLDKASEGLILFTNDTRWAEGIAAPESHMEKTYHVQLDCLADPELMGEINKGVTTEEGDFLRARKVKLLRRGKRNSWLEIVLDEGKNRHIRRLLSALGVHVLRLLRVAIGSVQLGTLAKGAYRHLTDEEKRSLTKIAPKSQRVIYNAGRGRPPIS